MFIHKCTNVIGDKRPPKRTYKDGKSTCLGSLNIAQLLSLLYRIGRGRRNTHLKIQGIRSIVAF